MTTLQLRIDEDTKSRAKAILDEVGLDMSTAIKLYLKQIALVKGIPFKIITENGLTLEHELQILKASAEAKSGINVTKPMKPKEALAYLRNIRLNAEKSV